MLCTTGTKTIRSTETTQANTPMRPIFSQCGSPTYQLSKYFTTILQPLTNESRHKVQSTKDFIDTIKTVQIPDDYRLVSFDVKSLFTSIPLQLALDCTETAITNSTHELPLPKDDIMDLLKLCLTFSFKHYKQLHDTAMGSPVSDVVAEHPTTSPRTKKHCHSGYATLTTHSQQYTKTKSTSSTNTLTNRIPTYSSPRKSKKTVKYLF